MSWTPEQRRRYAPAISETVRANATVRLASTIDALDPPARTGRPRLWSILTMLQALWRSCRTGAAWRHRHVPYDDLARRLVHDRRTLRAADHGMSEFSARL
jgi:hypothetical protein